MSTFIQRIIDSLEEQVDWNVTTTVSRKDLLQLVDAYQKLEQQQIKQSSKLPIAKGNEYHETFTELRKQIEFLLPLDVRGREVVGIDKIVCGVCHSTLVDYCESPDNYEEPKYWEDGEEFGVAIFYLCTGCSTAYAVGDLRGTDKDVRTLQEQLQRDKETAPK